MKPVACMLTNVRNGLFFCMSHKETSFFNMNFCDTVFITFCLDNTER